MEEVKELTDKLDFEDLSIEELEEILNDIDNVYDATDMLSTNYELKNVSEKIQEILNPLFNLKDILEHLISLKEMEEKEEHEQNMEELNNQYYKTTF